MIKFIAKIWAIGEINDYRRARKKRKLEEKIRHKQECDRIAKNLQESGYRDSYLKGMYMVLIGIISVILGAVIFPPISLVGLIVFIVGIIKAIVNIYKANN